MTLLRAASGVVVLLLALTPATRAQEAAATDSLGLRVFLDCNFFCDFDHVRREIAFVNWMRDRQDADVHVLGTAQGTGSGGREFTLNFIGLRAHAGRQDTLRYFSQQVDTEDQVRARLVQTLKIGLMRYVAGTPIAEQLGISYRAAPTGRPTGPVRDSWNFWVFRTSVGGSLNGESQQNYRSVNGSFSASRITERLKFTLRTSGRFNRSEFDLDSVTTYVDRSSNLRADALLVQSLGEHWSAGLLANVSASTSLNQDLAMEGGPAIEFDVFRYAESTRRQLTFLYSVGPAVYDYEQETIFDETAEVLPRHRLSVSLEVQQPWGSVNSSLEAIQYLHDLARHQVSLFGGIELKVVRGLSLNLFGNVARVKDQLYLSKAGATPEEILLQRRRLGTDYSYFANIGFSYTFGAVFNNVVNPRMGRAGGGGGFFFFN